jgi:hypothetical protein
LFSLSISYPKKDEPKYFSLFTEAFIGVQQEVLYQQLKTERKECKGTGCDVT